MRDDELRRELETLTRDAVARGVLRVVDDRGNMQRVQVSLLDGELADGAERMQNYGFTSVPEPGAEATVVFVCADRSHPVVIVSDDRRVRMHGLQPGEVAVYHKNGDHILFKNGNEIEVSTKRLVINASEEIDIKTKVLDVTASSDIRIRTPSLTAQNTSGGAMSSSMTGTLTTTNGDIVADGVSLKKHQHGGVKSGSERTGPPV